MEISIGKKIRELRKLKGMNQEQLGKLLNIEKSQISKYEKGTNQPPIDKIKKLAEIFDINPDELLNPESSVKRNNSNDPNSSRLRDKVIELQEQILEMKNLEGKKLDEVIDKVSKMNDEINKLKMEIDKLKHG